MFGYGYPNYYGAPGYGTPAQPMGQLEQLRMAQQPSQMQMPQQQTQQNSGLIWVQGEAGAKSYMVANGNSVLLMDSESQTFYIKSTDASGMPSMRIFDYHERQSGKPPAAAQQSTAQTEYVTREEFNALSARLDAMAAGGKGGSE